MPRPAGLCGGGQPRSSLRRIRHDRAISPGRVVLKAEVQGLEKFKVGPADLVTGPGQKAMYLLKQNPELYESAVEQEMSEYEAGNQGTIQKDALVLRRRVNEVRDKERVLIATELLYTKVCQYFVKLQIPLIPPLKGGGDIRFGQSTVNLKGLTDIYSVDALGLVRDHLLGILGMQGNPYATAGMVQIALFQAGQVYAMSALFGYYIRRVDARYQLEKLAGSFGAFGDDSTTMPPKSPFDDDKAAANSLKDYISNFGSEELQRMTAITSVEAQMTMESQVSALFGDLRKLKTKLLDAVGMVISNEEATEKLQKAIEQKQVESIQIATDDLRRLVLEAVAFGALLHDGENQVDSIYELTPSSNRRMGALTGDDDVDTGRMLPL